MAETPWNRYHRISDEIARKKRRLSEQQEELWEELKEAQKKCKHEKVTGGMFCNTCDICGLDDM